MYRLDPKVLATLMDRASRYADSEFDLFVEATAWEDWMCDFTDAAEGEAADEYEIHEMDEILRQIFSETHGLPYHYCPFSQRFRRR